MGSKTDAFEVAILAHIFHNTAIANIGDAAGLPVAATEGNLYVALFTTTPTESTAGTEATFTGYARQPVPRNSGGTGWKITGSTINNDAVISFGPCTGGSETILGLGIMTAVTGGDLLYWAAVDNSRDVVSGVTLEFAADTAIIVTED